MNSFKSRRPVEVEVKQREAKIDDKNDFPSLTNIVDKSTFPALLQYKQVAEKPVALKEEINLDYIPDGWVKYTLNKKTKKLVETYGVREVEKTPCEKQEEIFNELIGALCDNWTRNRNEFVKRHGVDYYNDIFLTKKCVETETNSDSENDNDNH